MRRASVGINILGVEVEGGDFAWVRSFCGNKKRKAQRS